MGDKGAQGAENFSKRMTKLSRDLDEVGSQLTMKVTAPIAAVGFVTSKLAIDFESSFAGVRKTVSATEGEFAELAQGIRDMSKRIPIDVNELNKTAEAAGQLGIHTENILSFTEVMAKLGVTTNLSSDQAATALARFANITGMSQQNFDRLGSSIVALGNNMATTEAEIVEFGMRIAGAGSQIGLSESQILGFGAALSSVGLNAEAGGTAISRVMIEMASSVANGGDMLNQFASVAGMTTQDFARMFKEDAAGALVAFITGLGEMEERGGSTLQMLEQMGLTEVRLRDALLRASGASELLTNSLKISGDGWERNTALTKEAEERFKTTASQLLLLYNRVKDVGITIGNALLPFIQKGVQLFDTLIPKLEKGAEWFAALDESSQGLIIAFVAVVAAIGPVITIVGAIIALLGAPFIGTIGLAVAALAALTAAGVLIIENWDAIKSSFRRTWETLKTDFFNLKNAIIKIWEDLTGGLKSLWEGFIEWLESTIPGLKGIFDKVGQWIEDTNKQSQAAWAASIKQAEEMERKRREAMKNAPPNPFEQAMGESKWGSNDIVPPAAVRAGVMIMTDYGDSIDGARTKMSQLGEVTMATGKKTEDANKKTEKGAEGLNGLAGGAGGAGDAIKDLNESLVEQNAALTDSIRLIGLEGRERIKMETVLVKEKGAKAALADANEALRLAEFDKKTQTDLIKSLDDKISKLKQQRQELFLTGNALIDYQVKMMEADAVAKGLSGEGLEQVRAKLAELRREMELLDAAKTTKQWMEDNLLKWVDPFTKNLLKIPRAVKKETEDSLTAIEDFVSNVASNINNVFAELIYNGMKGNFDSFKDLWKSTLDAMLQTFSQFVATLISNPIRISLEAMLNGTSGEKGYQVGDITRGIGGALKKIPGVGGLIDKAKEWLGDFAEWIPVIGDIVAGALAFLPMLTGLFKKTPRLDIELDEVRNDIERRTALVEDYLSPEMIDDIVQISVKRKAGLGAGGDEAIRKIIAGTIQGVIEDLQAIINKLPADMARALNEALLSTPIDTETVVGGERLLEFDAKGKEIKEKFQAFINGELQAKFLFAIDDFLQDTFETLGVLPEKAEEFLARKFEEFANAGSREERAAIGQEVMESLEAYVDAFNFAEGNLAGVTQTAVREVKALSQELGFKAVPSIGELRSKVAELIQTADIDPSVIQKYVDLRDAIVNLVSALASGIQNTISQIEALNSQYALGIDTSGASAAALAQLMDFYQKNKDNLSIEERQDILNQMAGFNNALAASQQAAYQAEQMKAIEDQKAGVQRQIDQQRVLREKVDATYNARIAGLEKELEFIEAMEKVNANLRQDRDDLFLSEDSPLTSVEKLNRVMGGIRSLETQLAGATGTEEQVAIIDQIRALQKEALSLAAEAFGVGSAEQSAIFQEIVARTDALIQLTDTQGRTSEQIQAEIEKLNAERNRQLAGIDGRIETLTSNMNSIGSQQIDATRGVSQEVKDNAAFLAEELQGILEEQLGMLEDVTSEGTANLQSIHDINEEMLVVQRGQLDQLGLIAQTMQGLVGQAATGGGAKPQSGGGGGGATQPITNNPFSPFYTGMATGGIVAEPVAGIGLNTGRSFAFGEGGIPEAIIPLGKLREMNALVNRVYSDNPARLERPIHSQGLVASTKDRIEIVLRNEGVSEGMMDAVEREVREGVLGQIIVKKVAGALDARGGR